MTQTLRRCAAAALATALVLTGAACSKDTKGTASPASNGDSSSTSSNNSDDSESSSSESSSSSSSKSDKPAGSLSAKDDSFTFDAPSGYEDAIDKVSVAGALAAVMDPASDTAFPTHIVVNSESSSASLDTVLSTVRDQFEKKYSATTKESTPPIDSIDGEDFRAWTTEPYKDGAQDVASAQIITKHDGTIYYLTVNTLPANRSTAGDALVDLAESMKWS